MGVRRFPEVALAWAGGLLRGCDAEMHGVDLYGRDSLLLGRLLTTLAPHPLCLPPRVAGCDGIVVGACIYGVLVAAHAHGVAGQADSALAHIRPCSASDPFV